MASSRSGGWNALSPTVTGLSARAENVLAVGAAAVLTALLVLASVRGTTFAIVACGAALYIFLLAAVGRERMAVGTLMAAFATAPMYKGIAASPSTPITPTDLLFGLAVIVLLPSLLRGRLVVPGVYVVGLALVVLTAMVASVASVAPLQSLINLVQWLMVLAVAPAIYVLWRPSPTVIDCLLWSYVAGHVVSVVYSVIEGAGPDDRYEGLTHHPNAFAEAGVIAAAILLYLFHRYRRTPALTLLFAAAALVCGQSVLTSGSRAAAVVLAVLVLMIPVVERSALAGFVLASLGALFIALLPGIVSISGEGSALARLAGSGDARASDSAREAARDAGIELFTSRPLLGHGLLDTNLILHDNLIEVAASIGVFGVLGYFLIMFALARPLFGNSPYRRLGYLVWAYLGLGAAIPGLWDWTIWMPTALAILAAVPAAESSAGPAPRETTARVGGAGRSPLTQPVAPPPA